MFTAAEKTITIRTS